MSNEVTGEVFDLSDFNTTGFTDAKPMVKFDPMKDGENQSGPLTVQINGIWLSKVEDKPNEMALNWTATVLDGKQMGATIYKKNRIVKGDSTSYRFLKTDLTTVGIESNDLNDLNKEEVKAIAKGKVLKASVKVNAKDTRYYDLKLHSVVVA